MQRIWDGGSKICHPWTAWARFERTRTRARLWPPSWPLLERCSQRPFLHRLASLSQRHPGCTETPGRIGAPAHDVWRSYGAVRQRRHGSTSHQGPIRHVPRGHDRTEEHGSLMPAVPQRFKHVFAASVKARKPVGRSGWHARSRRVVHTTPTPLHPMPSRSDA